ncbi:hypothetical protein niasHT_038456 [Heterodera trifolii]|uniref:Oxysterol-binding protein n=1 Tax=Heterodera trifolii TaxID=157864 RepID=A0ABD2IXK8_9BILA
MEGTLSKWTNVVHGWQHRYFVLNDDALCYYTSKEKMARGQQRGCIRLRGAALGIDEENNAQFTIAVDGKVFHLQGKNRAERDTWVRVLERVIHEKCGYYKPPQEDPLEELRKRVIIAENQSQTLMEQTRNLEQISARETDKADHKRKKMLTEIIATAKRLQSSVDHSSVLLRQVQRDIGTSLASSTDQQQKRRTAADKAIRSPTTMATTTTGTAKAAMTEEDNLNGNQDGEGGKMGGGAGGEPPHLQQQHRERQESEDDETCPIGGGSNGKEDVLNLDEVVSYSSSDDEFYDAAEEDEQQQLRNHCRSVGSAAALGLSGQKGGGEQQRKTSTDSPTVSAQSNAALRRSSKDLFRTAARSHGGTAHLRPSSLVLQQQQQSELSDWGQFDAKGTDYDAIYNNTHDEQDIGDINKQHGSVLMHLLSQVSVGMDLTKVTLPTFILERRSLLEMYADFFAHPDDFISAVDEDSPEIRFLAVLKYYLNSFFPARKSGVAKKPYNPILGETFRCRWTLPDTEPSPSSRTKGGPFPGSATNQVTFIAEQVSHHPPISAFYVEHPEAGVSCTTHIYTKSSFLGLAIGVQMVGKATVRIHNHDETYIATFPNGYGRAIMATPWFELAGKVELRCEQTGYRAEIDFLAKPFFRGKAHQIHGQIFHTSRKTAVMQLKGEWNGEIYLKRDGATDYQLFTDVRQKPDVRKECVPVREQEDRESRKLWRHVTAALFNNNIEIASQSKRCIEQRQRDEKVLRERLGQPWQPRFFVRIGDGSPSDSWRYCDALEQRTTTDGP